MTTSQIAALIASIGLPSAYDHFPEKAAPDLPFICFRYDQENNFNADNTTHQKIASLSVELYTANKDIASETAVENVASWVVPHSVGPRFPGPLLIRTRCPDTSPNSRL